MLIVFLAWRGANSLWVTCWDRERNTPPLASFDATELRVRRALDVGDPLRSRDAYHQRLQLLSAHVPPDGKVYFLHEFAGSEGAFAIRSLSAMVSLAYPRYVQPIRGLPLPESARRPPLADKPTFVLDTRRGDAQDAVPGFSRIARGAGAVLWREGRPK